MPAESRGDGVLQKGVWDIKRREKLKVPPAQPCLTLRTGLSPGGGAEAGRRLEKVLSPEGLPRRRPRLPCCGEHGPPKQVAQQTREGKEGRAAPLPGPGQVAACREEDKSPNGKITGAPPNSVFGQPDSSCFCLSFSLRIRNI